MKRNGLFLALSLAVFLVGCGDAPEGASHSKTEAIAKSNAHASKTLFPKKGEEKVKAPETNRTQSASVKMTRVVEKIVMSPEKATVESGKSILEEAILPEKELLQKDVAHIPNPAAVPEVKVVKAVAAAKVAKSVAAVDIVKAVGDVETLSLEDNKTAHGDPSMIAADQNEAAQKIQEAVYRVEAAKAASSATIAQSVKSVEDARSARATDDPIPAMSVVEAIKAREAAKIAQATAKVEIAKANAAADMAKSVAKVEMNRRLYGENSPEVADMRAKASGEIATAIGDVKVTEAASLASISESVAKVEIAKARAGIVSNSVEHGQKLYLKKLKKACGMNGAAFATMHTQSQWEEIRNMESFAHEIKRICPKLKDVRSKWESDLFDFCYEYAKDSGNVPSCGS